MGELTVTDLFCGAGGSSSGAEQVPGVRVRMAANHWRLAVETHSANLPHADHDVADISQVDPRRYPATDLLWASPECANHSQAAGRRRAGAQPDLFGEALPDEAADRSRATMWDVPRFVEAMILRGRPCRGFVVENVVDVRRWLYFDAWVLALRAAGYCLRFVYLNSMRAQGGGLPAPQSRDRWYCLGRLRAVRCPDLDRWARPAAWCPTCERPVRSAQSWKRPDRAPWGGRYRRQYVWRCPAAGCHAQVEPATLPAAVAIDWSLRGRRIGDRARPLADRTRQRIEAGLRKHARPLVVPVEGRDGVAARRVGEPLRTRISRDQDGLAVPPMLVPAGGTWNDSARSVEEPMRTRATRDAEGLVLPPSPAWPFIAELRGGGSAARPAPGPLAAAAAGGGHRGIGVRRRVHAAGQQAGAGPARRQRRHPAGRPRPGRRAGRGDHRGRGGAGVSEVLARGWAAHVRPPQFDVAGGLVGAPTRGRPSTAMRAAAEASAPTLFEIAGIEEEEEGAG
jgi:DNA (cytosine-5)-methyltransferase 1